MYRMSRLNVYIMEKFSLKYFIGLLWEKTRFSHGVEPDVHLNSGPIYQKFWLYEIQDHLIF